MILDSGSGTARESRYILSPGVDHSHDPYDPEIPDPAIRTQELVHIGTLTSEVFAALRKAVLDQQNILIFPAAPGTGETRHYLMP